MGASNPLSGTPWWVQAMMLAFIFAHQHWRGLLLLVILIVIFATGALS